MNYFGFKAVSKVIDVAVDHRQTVKEVLTNPVGATATVVLTLGTMHFANEKRKRQVEKINAILEKVEKQMEKEMEREANENA